MFSRFAAFATLATLASAQIDLGGLLSLNLDPSILNNGNTLVNINAIANILDPTGTRALSSLSYRPASSLVPQRRVRRICDRPLHQPPHPWHRRRLHLRQRSRRHSCALFAATLALTLANSPSSPSPASSPTRHALRAPTPTRLESAPPIPAAALACPASSLCVVPLHALESFADAFFDLRMPSPTLASPSSPAPSSATSSSTCSALDSRFASSPLRPLLARAPRSPSSAARPTFALPPRRPALSPRVATSASTSPRPSTRAEVASDTVESTYVPSSSSLVRR